MVAKMMLTVLGMAVLLVEEVHAAKKEDAEPAVAVVNVGGAIPDEMFEKALKEAGSLLGWRIRGGDAKTADPRDLVSDARAWKRLIRGNAVVAVFLVDDQEHAPVLSQPGAWVRLNAGGLRRDAPLDEKYRQRILKMMLKGIGLAAGAGGNPDPRCVMYWKSFTLAGIDETSASYGPYAYLPIRETLRELGGEAVFTH